MSNTVKLIGKRKLVAFFGGYLILLFTRALGLIDEAGFKELSEPLTYAFFGANGVEHGVGAWKQYLEVAFKKLELESKK